VGGVFIAVSPKAVACSSLRSKCAQRRPTEICDVAAGLVVFVAEDGAWARIVQHSNGITRYYRTAEQHSGRLFPVDAIGGVAAEAGIVYRDRKRAAAPVVGGNSSASVIARYAVGYCD
jgi:hypothetical protein